MSPARVITRHGPILVRDPGYAPRRLEVERRGDGSIVLFNPSPIERSFPTTVGALLFWAGRAPDRVWLAERSGAGWRRLAYAEAWAQVQAIAGGLARLPLGQGRPLLILARNGIDHALVAYAAMSQGIPIAPVSAQYGLAGANLSRLAHAVEVIEPAAVFVDDAEAFAGALQSDVLGGLPVIAGRSAIERLSAAAPRAPTAAGDDIAKLLLTSGSTGAPKAVICRHRAVAVNAAQIASCFDDDAPPVVVNQAPWSHSLGANAILQMVLQRGGTLYIDAGAPVAGRFSETVRNLTEIAPTYHNMVPAGWDLLAGELERNVALARRFFSRVRLFQYGGAALRQSTCDRIQAVAMASVGERISFSSGYGATETGPTATNVHWPNLTMGRLGLPVPGTTVKLAPVQDRLEFRVKGPQVTAGYYRNPDATAAAFDAEGFYRLGDAARLADPERLEDGLIFDGRLSENFKLSTGTFVTTGALRVEALSAIGAAAVDAVVCGENESGVGLLIFLGEHGAGDRQAREAIRAGLERFNTGKSAGALVIRALLIDGGPDAASGEVTEKGYVNQALARSRRRDDIARLFAPQPDPTILVLAAGR